MAGAVLGGHAGMTEILMAAWPCARHHCRQENDMIQAEALMWTLLLELPIVVAAAHGWRLAWRRALLAGCLASGLSHPLAWTLAMAMPEAAYRWGWYAIEVGVWAFEALLLGRVMGLTPGRAATLSLVANGFSALVGRFLL